MASPPPIPPSGSASSPRTPPAAAVAAWASPSWACPSPCGCCAVAAAEAEPPPWAHDDDSLPVAAGCRRLARSRQQGGGLSRESPGSEALGSRRGGRRRLEPRQLGLGGVE